MRPSRAAAVLALALAAGCTSPQPCPSPLEECDGECVDVQSNRLHCGGCSRGCAAGESCRAATCGGGAGAPCPERTGGAFVTLGTCGTTVKLWIVNGDFIAAAERASPGVPVLELSAVGDCDRQWSFSANPASARFAPAPPSTLCDVCPAQLQSDVADGVLDATTTWCPGTAAVLSVDRR